MGEAKRVRDGLAINPCSDHRRQPGAGRKEINILGYRTSSDRCIAFATVSRDHRHAAVVRYKNEIERRIIDEVLIARHAPQITSGDEFEGVGACIIEIRPRRERNIDVNLLGCPTSTPVRLN